MAKLGCSIFLTNLYSPKTLCKVLTKYRMNAARWNILKEESYWRTSWRKGESNWNLIRELGFGNGMKTFTFFDASRHKPFCLLDYSEDFLCVLTKASDRVASERYVCVIGVETTLVEVFDCHRLLYRPLNFISLKLCWTRYYVSATRRSDWANRGIEGSRWYGLQVC